MIIMFVLINKINSIVMVYIFQKLDCKVRASIVMPYQSGEY